MYKILTAASCLVIIALASPVPDADPAQRQLNPVQFKAPQRPAAFRPTVSYEDSEEEDIDTAATQARRPAPYVDDSYPIHNAIPLIQIRPQPRPHPIALPTKRPNVQPLQPFHEPEDEKEHTYLLDQISKVADAQTHLLPDDDDFEIPDNPDENTEIHVIEASSPQHYRNHDHDDDDEFESYHHHDDIPHIRHEPRAREHTREASTPIAKKQKHRQPEKKKYVKHKSKLDEDDKEEKEEEPDRLSILLPRSNFQCVDRNTGYYADEELGCEVFHYCHENTKHSWICPEGFTFHQVHLICMPPGNDNICAKSSQFHFVNEYLYKPVNLEEHINKPNVSLRYSDRYYPERFLEREEEEEEDERPQQKAAPVLVKLQQGPAAPGVGIPQRRPPPGFSSTFRPDVGQVFRSPEEINIPLQQRRPQYAPSRYQVRDDSDE